MRWTLVMCEPSLDDLLGDEMMTAVMRSAGVDRSGLRDLLSELARRLPAERFTPPCGCSTGRDYPRSAA